MEQRTPVPDESAYVARRVAHPWLLRQLWAAKVPADEAEEFLADLARAFGKASPTLVRCADGDSQAAMDRTAQTEVVTIAANYYNENGSLRAAIPVGLLCHEYAHILQYDWWLRMRGQGEYPKWEPHGPAFIDQLDRVAIEAAKGLE